MIFDAPPAITASAEPAPAPVIAGPDGTPHYLLGVNAYGVEAEIVRLEAVAARNGWVSERDPEGAEANRVKLMILFPRANAEQVRAFLDQVNRGELGQLTLESMIVPVRDAGRRR